MKNSKIQILCKPQKTFHGSLKKLKSRNYLLNTNVFHSPHKNSMKSLTAKNFKLKSKINYSWVKKEKPRTYRMDLNTKGKQLKDLKVIFKNSELFLNSINWKMDYFLVRRYWVLIILFIWLQIINVWLRLIFGVGWN